MRIKDKVADPPVVDPPLGGRGFETISFIGYNEKADKRPREKAKQKT